MLTTLARCIVLLLAVSRQTVNQPSRSVTGGHAQQEREARPACSCDCTRRNYTLCGHGEGEG